MQCAKCHTEVVAESAFCHKCGARLTEVDGTPLGITPNDPAASRSQLNPARGKADTPEQEVWHGSYSPRAMFPHAIGHAVLGIAALIVLAILKAPAIAWWIGVPLVLIVWATPWVRVVLKRMGASYRLTTQRLFHESGIIRRVTRRIDAIDIEDVSCEQGVLDRIFGVGNVRVMSTDRDEPLLLLAGIESAREVVDMIDRTRRAERLRRGLHIETS